MNNFIETRQLRPMMPAGKAGKVSKTTYKKSSQDLNKQDFSNVLEDKLETISFSKHAQNRIESRNIDMDKTKLDKLNEAIEKAKEKGAKESLVLLDKTAFVVSVENRTVITAADESQLKENVFTNIDSAVIL
ncbi:TIGR02530 family flagellar biosynthesis protein [Natranaerobius trueperi]|uniref:Flagellar protein n=1 Tax=Natranaerobius trueperi TaxID=759412 RepID=A0A226BZK7_9FIRM|nr:TIGR02530 family flagellar biosynthesis protein [Natranaerobius trueperi]OWZ84232.1 flagellar protein [Natranaerobius trueperi]